MAGIIWRWKNLLYFQEKIENNIEKFEKLVTNLHDETEYVIDVNCVNCTVLKSWISFKGS